MSAALVAENPRIHLGANNPPEPTPFDLARNAINDLTMEAKNWLDGEAIENQAQADAVGLLLDSLRRAAADADAARIAENKPFDEGKAEVQARYAPLIADTKGQKGKAVLAIAACKTALGAWLRKIDEQKRAAAAAARAEADRIAAEAAAAMRAAEPANLEAREDAEALAMEARRAAAAANRTDNDRAQALGGARATTLRSVWTAELTDEREAARHYWSTNPSAFTGFLQGLADTDVRAGKRQIPGVRVVEDRRVV